MSAAWLVNGFPGAWLGLDPVDELGEPPVRPALDSRGARFPGKYLIHHTLLTYQVPKAPDCLNPDPRRGYDSMEVWKADATSQAADSQNTKNALFCKPATGEVLL
jgi:hypothetical protein